MHAVQSDSKEQEKVMEAMARIGFLLLCGGQSKRMGSPKALLEVGGMRMLDRAARAGEGFAQRIFSANDDAVATPEGFVRCADVYPGCGPMAGIHAAFTTSDCDALVVAPCDAPYYDGRLAQFLAAQYDGLRDAWVLLDCEGRMQPLCGMYSRKCLPVLDEHLRAGKLRMKQMLEQMDICRLELPEEIGNRVFVNINTPQEFEAYRTLPRE